ncbi:hypothetical protein [Enterococcus olivae]
MARRKTPDERLKILEREIIGLEDRRASDLLKIQEKKKLHQTLEEEIILKQVKAYKLNPSELKKLLAATSENEKAEILDGNELNFSKDS